MKLTKSILFVSTLSVLAFSSANATTVITSILAVPASSFGTNTYGGFSTSQMYDGTAPTLADIGTNRTNDGTSWAVWNTTGPANYVVYDMGATVSFASILYSQRDSGAGDINQNWTSVDIWASNTDPGTPTVGGDATRAGHVTIAPLTLTTLAAGQNLNQYDLTGDGSNISARYVTFRFYSTGANANPGGNDLWLGAAVPEPGAALLGGLGLLGLLRRRRI